MLVMDYAPLQWMHTNKEVNARVTRWFLSLHPFKFEVRHRPGRQHLNADALSRMFVGPSPPKETSYNTTGGGGSEKGGQPLERGSFSGVVKAKGGGV